MNDEDERHAGQAVNGGLIPDPEPRDYPNTGSREIPLTLTVTVPDWTGPQTVADAIDGKLDEPPCDWGAWIVGYVQPAQHPAVTGELARLLSGVLARPDAEEALDYILSVPEGGPSCGCGTDHWCCDFG